MTGRQIARHENEREGAGGGDGGCLCHALMHRMHACMHTCCVDVTRRDRLADLSTVLTGSLMESDLCGSVVSVPVERYRGGVSLGTCLGRAATFAAARCER